jgi:hypothetical protein
MSVRKGMTATVTRSDRSMVWRPLTDADRAAWLASDDSKGMTCDGETKLSPLVVTRPGSTVGTVTVVSGRATSPRTSYARWGGTPKGCALVRDADGTEWYCYRASLVAA